MEEQIPNSETGTETKTATATATHVVMLTSVREWVSMLALGLLLCLLVPGQVGLGDGASVTWGHVGKYASPLLTEDVYLTPAAPGRDLVYGSQVRCQQQQAANCLISLGISGRMPAITTGLRVFMSRI